jgi:hypothetical protein
MKIYWIVFFPNVFACLGIMPSFWERCFSGFSELFPMKPINVTGQDDRTHHSAICGDTDRHVTLFEFPTLFYHRNQNLCSWAMQNARFECRARISTEISRQSSPFQQSEASNYERLFNTLCFIYDNDQSLGRVSDQEFSRSVHSSEDTYPQRCKIHAVNIAQCMRPAQRAEHLHDERFPRSWAHKWLTSLPSSSTDFREQSRGIFTISHFICDSA